MSSLTRRLERPPPRSRPAPAGPDPPFTSPSHPLAIALRALSNAFREKHTNSFPAYQHLLTTHSSLPTLLPTYNPLLSTPALTIHLLDIAPPHHIFTLFTLYYLYHATPPPYRRPFALSPTQFADLYRFYLRCVGGGRGYEDAVWCYGELRRRGALWIVPDVVVAAVAGEEEGGRSKRRVRYGDFATVYLGEEAGLWSTTMTRTPAESAESDEKDEDIGDDDEDGDGDDDDDASHSDELQPPPPPPPSSTLGQLEHNYNAIKAALGEPLSDDAPAHATAGIHQSLDTTVVLPLRQADSVRAALRAQLLAHSEEPIPSASLNAAAAAAAAAAAPATAMATGTRKRGRKDA
ncbi:hypothetical protein BDZ88DRAFT_421515 [Geranomyces variabilis]|nr:hypothetical protein BDZ88DRAFT_421515 [Geranomyces variabilis]KAJ3143245.1 hypothetical protein HDU90_000002 [Geranomyces variabilis]